MVSHLGRQRMWGNLRGDIEFALNAGHLEIFLSILTDIGGDVFQRVIVGLTAQTISSSE